MQRGGDAIDDPLAWWDSLPDDVCELWKAHWRCEPWGMDWDRHAVQVSKLDNILAILANKGLHKGHPNYHSRYRPEPPIEFMPPDYLRDDAKKKSGGILSQLDTYAKATVKNGNHD